MSGDDDLLASMEALNAKIGRLRALEGDSTR